MINPGDIYESCNYHPVFCTQVHGDDIWGISLIDGTLGHGCSLKHCGVKKLTIAQAMAHKNSWVPTNQRKDHPYWKKIFERDGLIEVS